MTALQVVNGVLFALDAAIQLADQSGRLRKMAADAIKEGRTFSDDEMESLRKGAEDAIQKARDHD